MSQHPASVSVVVPCRNEHAHVGALIDALRQQQVTPGEIIVVDGGSTDGTREVLDARANEAHRVEVRVLTRQDASIPEAVNAAVRDARGDVIVRLDAHSEPSNIYIARALDRLAEDRAGVVGGVWHVAPGAKTATAAAIARAAAHPLGAGDAAYRIGQSRTEPVDVDTVPFGCFRRAVWESLGGLDESLLANEDYEFNYRVRQAGLRVILDPAIHCTYFARPTLTALAIQYFRYGWWKVQMLRKHPDSLRWRQAVPAGFVASIAGLLALGAVWPVAWFLLAAQLALYAAVVVATSVRVCVREGGWSRLLPLAGAFSTIHLAWGSGALVNLLTLGSWPRARRRTAATPSAPRRKGTP
jgi:glycosyltransferase involved in cell wall biosynthesis